MGAQAVRVGEVLHGERVLGQSREAVQVDAGAERDDELVVMEIDRHAPRALHDDDLLLVEVDAHDLGLPHLQPVQQLAERHDRVGGMDRGGRDLRQERLEDEIVVGVDELDLELAARPSFSSALAANTPPKPPPITSTFFLVMAISGLAQPHIVTPIPTPMLHCVKSRLGSGFG